MNLRSIANLLLHACVVLAIPRFSAAQPVFYTAHSLEWRVASSDVVVRATIADVKYERGRDHWDWVTLTLDVHETLKGEAGEFLTFVTTDSADRKRYETMQEAQREYLWFLVRNEKNANGDAQPDARHPLRLREPSQSIIRLGPPIEERPAGLPEPRIITAELDGLEAPEDLLKAARAAAQFDAGIPGEPASHAIELPPFHELPRVGPQPGTNVGIRLPVDRRLESLAHRLIQSPHEFFGPEHKEALAGNGFSTQLLRHEGVKALRHFHGPANVELLKSLLDDSAVWHRSGAEIGEPARREYYIRKEAFDILNEWGIDIAEPVLSEAIINPGAPPSTAALTAVHGPANMRLVGVDIPIELGVGSTPELLRLLFNAERGIDTDLDLKDLRDGIDACQGFALFEWGNEEPVLVFYVVDPHDGFHLQLDDGPMLFQRGDRDPTERAWGRWFDPETGWIGWEARQRIPDGDRDVGWQPFGHIHVPRAK